YFKTRYSLLQSTKYFCYWRRKIITNNVRFEEMRCIDNQTRYWRQKNRQAGYPLEGMRDGGREAHIKMAAF
ncbi:hypothetical protein K0M31_013587, partial [Melipona bicolor]